MKWYWSLMEKPAADVCTLELKRAWEIYSWQVLRHGNPRNFERAGFTIGPRNMGRLWSMLRILMGVPKPQGGVENPESDGSASPATSSEESGRE
jgi:hypothetical protein